MSENIERSVRINFGRASKARKAKVRKKVRESSVDALKCYKKWVTHDHESVDQPVVACRGCGDEVENRPVFRKQTTAPQKSFRRRTISRKRSGY